MDIPLPDAPPVLEPSVVDIPIPEDTNRYSPSLPIEDDPTEVGNDLSDIALPKSPPKREGPITKPIVLGKLAAKKRLLAFSAAKQNVSAALLSGKAKKEEGESKEAVQVRKKPKKGVLDKARDTISEIEELKRRENEVRESMQLLYPMWGSHGLASTTSSLLIPNVLLEGNDNRRTVKIESLVDQLLEKKVKREKREQERKRKEEERRSRRSRGDSSKEPPRSWRSFKAANYKVYHFRRLKYKWDKSIDHSRKKRRSSICYPALHKSLLPAKTCQTGQLGS